MADPQQTLNNAFPGAETGDAVVDELTNDVWVYDGSLWINNGGNPGEYLVDPTPIPTHNETLLVTCIMSTGFSSRSLNYGLQLLSELNPVSLGIGLQVSPISVKIDMSGETKEFEIVADHPDIRTGIAVFVPLNKVIAVVAIPPADIKASVQVQAVISIAVSANSPYIYTAVNCPSKVVSVSANVPYISTPVNATIVNIAISPHVPIDIGSVLSILTASIGIQPLTPYRVGQGMPSAKVYLYGLQPSIRTGLVVPKTDVSIVANLPTIGSRLVANTIAVSVQSAIPTISAIPGIDIQWPAVSVLINTDTVGNGTMTNKAYAWWINSTPVGGYNVWGNESSILCQNSVTKFNPVCMQLRSASVTGIISRPFYILNNMLNPNSLSWTIDFWFRADTTSFSATNDKIIFGSRYTSGNNTYEHFTCSILGPTTGATLRFRMALNNVAAGTYSQAVFTSTANAIVPNTWYHVVIDCLYLGQWVNLGGTNGTKRNYRFGIDGNYGPTYTNPDGTSCVDGSFATIVFGQSDVATVTTTNEFTGYIDDFRVSAQPKWIGYGNQEYYLMNSTSGTYWYGVRRFPGDIGTPYDVPTRAAPRIAPQNETFRWWMSVRKKQASNQDIWWWTHYSDRPSIPLAIDQFVRDCKNDNIWDSISYCVPFLESLSYSNGSSWYPLKDPSLPYGEPGLQTAGYNIASYDRYRGITGNGTSTYISCAFNSTSQNNNHYAVYTTAIGTGPLLSQGFTEIGESYMDIVPGLGGTRHTNKNGSLATSGSDAMNISDGFFGMSRNNSENYSIRIPGFSGTRTLKSLSSSTPDPFYILARYGNTGALDAYASHRISIFTCGTSIDLEKLEKNMTALKTRLDLIYGL